jgi:hypothetical protein
MKNRPSFESIFFLSAPCGRSRQFPKETFPASPCLFHLEPLLATHSGHQQRKSSLRTRPRTRQKRPADCPSPKFMLTTSSIFNRFPKTLTSRLSLSPINSRSYPTTRYSPTFSLPKTSTRSFKMSSAQSNCTDLLRSILDANETYAAAFSQADPTLLKKLQKGQSPRIFWLGCSDSRVSAELYAPRALFCG